MSEKVLEICNEFPSSAVLRKDRHDLAQSREPDLGLKFAEQEIKSASPAVRLQADNRRTIFLLLDGANDQSKFDEFGLAVHTIYQEKLSGEAKPLSGGRRETHGKAAGNVTV